MQSLRLWGDAVRELLEKVDQMVQKHEGRDTGQGARPKGTSSWTVYTPPVQK